MSLEMEEHLFQSCTVHVWLLLHILHFDFSHLRDITQIIGQIQDGTPVYLRYGVVSRHH